MTAIDYRRSDIELAAYKVGYRELGAVLTCFSHLLLRLAHRMGSGHLAFVARDGELLMRSTMRLVERLDQPDRHTFSYVHLSRQTSFLPALETLDEKTLGAAFAVRGDKGTLSEALAYLGMPLAPIAVILARLDISPERTDLSPGDTAKLIADEQFQQAVRTEGARKKALLEAYLAQERIGAGPATLLVDIGWRGSILANLATAFSEDEAFKAPTGAFLGLWSETEIPSKLPASAIGLIADMRRRRNALEASAWFAAFLLEAVCRANEGTTVGYEFRGNKVVPILAGDSESRRAEAEAAPIVTAIRRGVMDFIDGHGAAREWIDASEKALRLRAQRSLLRLACFPRNEEILVGRRLVHTEGHAPEWWTPLIAPTGPRPIIHPRRWLAGLASPWRAGYVQHTGGPLLAAGFLLMESVLLASSPNVRNLLSQLARRAADGSFRHSAKRRTP